MDVGFLYKNGKSGRQMQIKSDGTSVLRTDKDPYQIFFRPHQNCYVYLLQKDSAGKWYILIRRWMFDVGRSSFKREIMADPGVKEKNVVASRKKKITIGGVTILVLVTTFAFFYPSYTAMDRLMQAVYIQRVRLCEIPIRNGIRLDTSVRWY